MVGENTWINVSPHLSINLLIEMFIGISIIYFYVFLHKSTWMGSNKPQVVVKAEKPTRKRQIFINNGFLTILPITYLTT